MMEYYPLLRSQRAESAACSLLPDDVAAGTKPIVEFVPPTKQLFGTGRKAFGPHVVGTVKRWSDAWAHRGVILLDPELICRQQQAVSPVECIREIETAVKSTPLRVIPVLRATDSEEEVEAKCRITNAKRGIAIRLVGRTIRKQSRANDAVERLLGLSGFARNRVRLILDLGYLEDGGADELRAEELDALGMLARLDEFRAVCCSATTFPVDLSDFKPGDREVIPRLDWQVWSSLSADGRLPGNAVFSDYGIQNPAFFESDLPPNTSASIRYTLDDGWLVLRGRGNPTRKRRGPPPPAKSGQYPEHCRWLIESGLFYGPEFSFADRYIVECANGEVGNGNAETWRRIGSGHHICVVRRQLDREDAHVV